MPLSRARERAKTSLPVVAASACHVFDIQRFSIHDGPGIRTTVFLEGCPLRCGWCQNPESWQRDAAHRLTPEAILEEVLEDRDYYDTSGGGLTLSGGEPLLHPAAARALLEEAKRAGLHTCVQTSGAVPEASVAAVLGCVDLFQLDLKHMSSERHRALTGMGTERIHANARFLVERGAHVELRMPVLPGLDDDDENLAAVARFLGELEVSTLRLVPYQNLYLDKYRSLGLTPGSGELEPPSAAALDRITERFARDGVHTEVDA